MAAATTIGRRAVQVLTCVLLPSTALAQHDSTTGRIDAARIDAVFSTYAGHESPGCAVGVYRAGAVAFARGYGMADLERQVPITPTTLFDIGSTSKQFAAAAIALLVGDGAVRFEDDVRTYVPELPDYGTPITLDHLVRHTSGLRDYIGLLYMGGRKFEDASDDAEALSAIVRQKALNFAPGTRWDYSNSGFFLLSVVVQRVTGQTLAAFARARIFEPLAMARTHFRDDHTRVVPGRAMGYSPRAGGGLELDMSNWDQTGDGAVWTSIDELVRWDRNFTDHTVGGAELIPRLQEPGRLTSGKAHQYGRGLFLDRYRGLERVHHGGSWAGFRAMFMRFPTTRTSIAVLCNVGSANTQALAERVADVALDGTFPEAPPVMPERSAVAAPAAGADTTPYVGLYYSEIDQSVARIAARDGVLYGGPTGLSAPLAPIGSDRFQAAGAPVTVQFFRRGTAPADSLQLVLLGEARPFVRVEPARPTAAELAAFAGEYYSAELDASYRLVADDSGLRMRSRTQSGMLQPAMQDAFSGPVFVRFFRERGRVAGFDLSMSRVKRLRFERR